MNKIHQDIVREAYSKIRERDEATKSNQCPTTAMCNWDSDEFLLAESIKRAKANPTLEEVGNMCVVINQMRRARSKKDGKHDGFFRVLSPKEIFRFLEDTKTTDGFSPSSALKSDLRQYSKSYDEYRNHDEVTTAIAFRDLVDSFGKYASECSSDLDRAITKLTIMNNNEIKLAADARFRLFRSIRSAYESGSPLLHVHAALISSSPNYSKIATDVMKVCVFEMCENKYISKEDRDKFLNFGLSSFESKVASDPLPVNKNRLTDAFQDFLKFSLNQNEVSKNLAQVKLAKEKMSQKSEKLANAFGSGLPSSYGSPIRPSLLEGLPKTIGAILGLTAATKAVNSTFDKMKNSSVKSENKVHFQKLIEKFPELNNIPNIKEYFYLIVEANPSYKDKYYHLKTIIKTLVDQNQVVTPDLTASLVKGNRKPSEEKGVGISDIMSARKFEDDIIKTQSWM